MKKFNFSLSLIFLNIFFIEASCRDSSVSTEEFHIVADKIKNLERKNKELEENLEKLEKHHNQAVAKLATAENEIIKLATEKPK